MRARVFFGVWGLALGISASLNGADWPQWRGPHRDGASDEKIEVAAWPADGPKRLWKTNIGIGFGSIAIAAGKVFAMGNTNNEDTVFCLNADLGEVVWKYSYACPLTPQNHEGGPSATPTVAGDRVFTFSKAGQVHCFDATSGKVLWSVDVTKEFGAKPPHWGFASSPLVVGDLFILNVGVSGLVLDKNTGKTVWKSANEPLGFQNSGPAGYASPVLYQDGGQTRVAIFGHDALWGVNPADGNVLWQFPWKTSYGENTADPLAFDGRIFISSGHGLGSALLKAAGDKPEVVWKNPALGNHIAASVAHRGHLYGFSGVVHRGDANFFCVDSSSGETKWSKSGLRGSLIRANNKLLLLTTDGQLIVVDANPSEYKELVRAQVIGGKCWTPPALAHGRLYIRNAQGEVICLQVK